MTHLKNCYSSYCGCIQKRANNDYLYRLNDIMDGNNRLKCNNCYNNGKNQYKIKCNKDCLKKVNKCHNKKNHKCRDKCKNKCKDNCKKWCKEKSRKWCSTNSESWYYRSLDGRNNNLQNYLWGCAGQNLNRICPPQYSDGISAMAIRGPSNPNPRYISNVFCQTTESHPNNSRLTDLFWAWGQFIDHSVDITFEQHGPTAESANIICPPDDPVLPNGIIPFTRSMFNPTTGTSPSNPRQQPNMISSYIDATNVYGTTSIRMNALRKMDGTGQLKTLFINEHQLLPLNTEGLPNSAPHGSNPADFFLAGDIRSNENLILTCMHTIFVLEHNRLAKEIEEKNPQWGGNDERLFEEAKKMVIAFMDKITYEDFCPLLLGPKGLDSYQGYDQFINADVLNEFSTCVYRLGHTMVPETLLSIKADGTTEDVDLMTAFFNPDYIKQNGIEGLIRGAAQNIMEEVDTFVVEALRSNLFGPPDPTTKIMLDLASLNIQRGRDHGLADYNSLREAHGLPRLKNFSDITSDVTLQNKLSTVYDNIDSIDPWIGGLCEDHVPGAQIGPLFHRILSLQLRRLRDCDRFYYINDTTLTKEQRENIKRTTLRDIIMRNTNITGLQENVFIKP